MSLVKNWPALLCVLLSGCSLQQHTDRAERLWLNANSLNTTLHSVSLAATANADAAKADLSFANATAATTYLRGQINSPDIDELSGMAPVLEAVSHSDSKSGHRSDKRSGNRYWAINDSGNKPRLFALTGGGSQLADIKLPLKNRDWEDLASFTYRGENWIAISETGDNVRRHAVSSIYFFKQPDINSPPIELPLHHRLDFSYEDGPKNVESMAVAASEGRIYLIAKDSGAANIYTLPLSLPETSDSASLADTLADSQANDPATPKVARKAGQLAELKSTSDDTWWERWFAGRVLLTATALDFSADNQAAVVANYRHVYLFRRAGDESWAVALSRPPQILTSHRMQQSESVAFSADMREIIVSSEGVGAPMLAIRPSAAPVAQ